MREGSGGKLALASVVLNGLLILSDWLFYRGLLLGLGVGIASAVFNLQLVWAWLLCLPRAPRDRWLALSGLAALCAIGGMALFVTAGSRSAANLGAETLEELFAWPAFVSVGCSGLLYALFEVGFKASPLAEFTSLKASLTATGCLGVANLLTCWPILLALHLTGVEHINPLSSRAASELALNVCLALLYNASISLAIARCSPVSVSAASVLAVPLALLVDATVFQAGLGAREASAAALIVASCLAIVACERRSAAEAGTPAESALADAAAGPDSDLARDESESLQRWLLRRFGLGLLHDARLLPAVGPIEPDAAAMSQAASLRESLLPPEAQADAPRVQAADHHFLVGDETF